MRTTESKAEQLLEIISVGYENAQNARDIASLISMDARELRRLINGMRKDGHAIISCESGYYLYEAGEDTIDAVRFIHNLKAHAREELIIADAVYNSIMELERKNDKVRKTNGD